MVAIFDGLALAAWAIFGLIVGSFLTVVVYRVPEKMSLRGRSKCPSCGSPIRARDNVPVFSYVFLRGRCSQCKARISRVYPAIELTTCVLFVAARLGFDSSYVAGVMAAFFAVLVAVSAIDIERKIIPNRIVYPAIPVFAAAIVIGYLVGTPFHLLSGAVGLVAYGGALLAVAFIYPRGMGMGDGKLSALIGLVLGSLGPSYVVVAAAMAFLGGGIGALVVLALGRDRKSVIPFGPYLAAGAVVAAFVGPAISNWYLNLTGLR